MRRLNFGGGTIQTGIICAFHSGAAHMQQSYWSKVTSLPCFLHCKISVMQESFVVVYAEFLLHRVVFFVLGLVLMAVAHTLSESVVFYYGGAMTIGIFLVILIILFQVIYNPLYSALYSSSWALQLMVGIGNGGWCHSCNGSIELTYCLIWNYHLDYGRFEDCIWICIGKILNQQYT